MSGIKGTHTILYVKTEFHSHTILENLCIFVKTGVYPGLFTEKEICHITGEIVPSLNSAKRVERTQLVHSNFLNSIQEKCHIIIGLESGLTSYKLSNLLRDHSGLLTEFYVDTYRAFKLETLNSISRFYLALQIEENKARKLNKKYNRYDDEEDDLTSKEIQLFSSVMADLHTVAYDHYVNNFYNKNQRFYTKTVANRAFMAKPFSVSMFKQVSLCFRVYMKRIKEQESLKIEKFERAFRKLNQVSLKIKGG